MYSQAVRVDSLCYAQTGPILGDCLVGDSTCSSAQYGILGKSTKIYCYLRSGKTYGDELTGLWNNLNQLIHSLLWTQLNIRAAVTQDTYGGFTAANNSPVICQ